MKPLPRAPTGSTIALDGDLYNYIAENLQRMDNWTVQPPLNLQQSSAGNLLSLNLGARETVAVAILSPAASGGYYNGSILYGPSNGGNGGTNSASPATYPFQLLATAAQTQTDGPTYQTDSHGATINNALVINLPEQYVLNTHKLNAFSFVTGKVMGQTNETTPRTIVYVDEWPIRPVIAKVVNIFATSYGGVYQGEIVSGQFASGVSAPAQPLASSAAGGISGSNDCWITNVWEQSYRPLSAGNLIPVGTFIPGLMCGWPTSGSYPGGTYNNRAWYQVYTWFTTQATAPTTVITTTPTSTGGSAGSSYTTTEQAILNHLVADVGSLWAMLLGFYTNMQRAGYTL